MLLSILLFSISSLVLNAQVFQSCDCKVDTLGYADFLQTITPEESATFQYQVYGTFAIAYGIIGSTTPAVVQDLIDNYPAVTTIIMQSCLGSEDDDANLVASMLIYNRGYKMYLPDNGYIASGAVDMFLAGYIRVVDATFDPVGVHAWSDGVHDATYYPVGHAYHQPYINYYTNVGFTQQEAESFYYFTINAATANEIYWMSDAEINQYKIRTCSFSSSPNYLISNINGTLTANLANASYQWLDCTNNYSLINSETNQSFTPVINGDYAVQITEIGCMDTSACENINTVKIINHESDSKINIYPNPNFGTFNIDYGNMDLPINISIFDLNGRLIYYSIQKNWNLLKIESNLTKGLYLVSIKTKDTVYSNKLLIY